jgi:hypothetical protein
VFASPQSEVDVFKSFRQSAKDVLRNVLLMIYGAFVFVLPRIVLGLTPDQTTLIQILGGAAIGQAFINIIYIGFGIDSNRSLINKLDEQAAHIQALEDKLILTNTLLQQLVDKANQPTTNALPTPANLTNAPDVTTNLASPDQAVAASNGHVSNGS